MSIDIRGDDAAKRMLAELSGIYPLVAYRAINKTIDKGKTLVSRKIRDEVNLSAAYVGKKLDTVKATQTSLFGKIMADKRGLLLSRYPSSRLSVTARSRSKYLKGYPSMTDGEVNYPAIGAGRRVHQMSVKTSSTGGRERGKFFLIRLDNSGAIGMAVRTGYNPGKGKSKRKENKALYKVKYGPSPSQVFNTLKPDLEPLMAAEYQDQFAAQLDYQLSRLQSA